MSGAFFAVYMLSRIGIPMSGVILLALLSQVTNIYFFRVWGAIADRSSNKSVLAVSVPLFVVLLLLYPFTYEMLRKGKRPAFSSLGVGPRRREPEDRPGDL